MSLPLGEGDLHGAEGRITGRLGRPEYPALEVLLEDDERRHFWHHKLEEAEERGAPGHLGGPA